MSLRLFRLGVPLCATRNDLRPKRTLVSTRRIRGLARRLRHARTAAGEAEASGAMDQDDDAAQPSLPDGVAPEAAHGVQGRISFRVA